MIQVRNISKTIGNRMILNSINFSIPSGCIVGIIGHNGAGKTTLLRLMAGLLSADQGEILFDGQQVKYENKLIRYRIGYMPEDGGLYRRLNLSENLRFALRFYPHITRPEEQIEKYLKIFDLTNRRGEKIGKLSGGMRRKILFIKSIVHKPETLLLDEPFNGFDVESRLRVCSILHKMSVNGGAVCISSHSTGELEKICNTYLFIKDGFLIFGGGVKDIYGKFASSENESLASLYLKVMKSQ